MRLLVALTAVATISFSLLQLTQPSREELARKLDRQTRDVSNRVRRNISPKPKAIVVGAAPQVERRPVRPKPIKAATPKPKKLARRVKEDLYAADSKKLEKEKESEEDWSPEWDDDYYPEDDWVHWGDPWPEWDDESYSTGPYEGD